MRENQERKFKICLTWKLFANEKSLFALPIVTVKKKGETNRVSVDYQRLDKFTEADPQYISREDNLF